MEFLAVARVLWRCRIAVAAGGVVAIVLALVFALGTKSTVGVASTRVMLDTPRSQTVNTNPPNFDTLPSRAALLADLTADNPSRQRIANDVGIATKSLVVRSPAMSIAPVAAPLPRHALDVASAVPEPYELSIRAIYPLPIVAIDARAPSGAQAAKLATAAAAALKAAAPSEFAHEADRFVVEDVGPVRSHEVVDGPRRMFAVIVALVVFGLWCACITIIVGVSRARGSLLRTRAAAVR